MGFENTYSTGVWPAILHTGVQGACPHMAIVLFWPHISNNARAKVVEIKVKVVVLG